MDNYGNINILKILFNIVVPLCIFILPVLSKNKKNNKKTKNREIKREIEPRRTQQNKKMVNNHKEQKERHKPKVQNINDIELEVDRLIYENEKNNIINNKKIEKIEKIEEKSNTEFDLKTAFIYSEILQKPLALRK